MKSVASYCTCYVNLLSDFYDTQLRQSLDGLLNDMKNLPARLRQYASFEYVQKTIKNYLKVTSKTIPRIIQSSDKYCSDI